VVTPRTLELASNLVKTRHLYSNAALRAALTGTIGSAATNSLLHFIEHHESMTPWSEIMANPKSARMPPNAGACAVLSFSAGEYIKTKDDLDAFMIYLARQDAGYDTDEFQVIFGVRLAGQNSTDAKRRFGVYFTGVCRVGRPQSGFTMSDSKLERDFKRKRIEIMRSKQFVELGPVMMMGTREFTRDVPTACTNGRDEKYNPDFIFKWGDKGAGFITLHENWHKAARHLEIYEPLWKLCHKTANSAMDTWIKPNHHGGKTRTRQLCHAA